MVDITDLSSKELQLSDGLCLSVDKSPETFYLSDSKGYLYLIDADTFSLTSEVKGCDYEAWTIHSDIQDNHIFYSGGDDCKFKMWDKRSMEKCFEKSFDMGICSIASHGSTENLVAFGSYNEKIYFWDKRSRKIINEINVGGGVWRLNWHEQFPYILSTAAMHGGCKIIKYSKNRRYTTYKLVWCLKAFFKLKISYFSKELKMKFFLILAEILFSYLHHQSMVYGIDVDYNRVASCSFYDRSLQLWTLPEDLLSQQHKTH